jgi:hypothetical protein
MEKVNSKIAILPRHLTFCLGICLNPLPRPPCFVQDVITKIQDVMASSPRRHGPSQRALTSPLIGHIFCTRQNHPNPRHRWVHKALIALRHPFPQKRLQI